MSFSKHACRHASWPSAHGLNDYVWFSEDFLASTFQRFIRGQCRYESRVPGPLEARRRLAKRKNTALASAIGPGPLDDIGSLFGRNGGRHMKWGVGQDQGLLFNPPGSSVFPSSPNSEFFNRNGSNGLFDDAAPLETVDEASRERRLKELLKDCQTASDVEAMTRELNIDLRGEPAYSRLIFEHLLAITNGDRKSTGELVKFLDDPHLNIHGAGNYLAAVEHFVTRGTALIERPAPLGSFIRALELGRVSGSELSQIISSLYDTIVGGDAAKGRYAKLLVFFYTQMWDAIGRCGVYQHKDLDQEVVETWLGTLLEMDSLDTFTLANRIIIATQDLASADSPWPSSFILRWLEYSEALSGEEDGDHVCTLLDHFTQDAASLYIISTTEWLVTSGKHHLLETWRSSLSELSDVEGLVSLPLWGNVSFETSARTSALTVRQQIVLRLWVLQSLSRLLRVEDTWVRDKCHRRSVATDLPAFRLLVSYKYLAELRNEDFMGSLMDSIHDLQLPPSGILTLAAMFSTMKTGLVKRTWHMLNKLERSRTSLIDAITDPHICQAMLPHFFPDLARLVRQIDITSPAFVDNAIHIANTGNSERVWALFRILRAHIPLKIALSMSHTPIPDPSEMALVRYYPRARGSGDPDPHACLEVIHLLALAISNSKTLSTRNSFKYVWWLHTYINKHNAPFKPSFARALYHAGVVRFRREGRKMSPVQFAWIMERVKAIEDPEMLESFLPHIGEQAPKVIQFEYQ